MALVRSAATGLAISSLAACHAAGVLDPHGPVSAAERLILMNATAIMLVVVAPVIVLTLGFAWWYRSGNRRAAYDPEWAYSGRIELVVWSIPAMVVILLSGVAWIGSHELDPAIKLQSGVNSSANARSPSDIKPVRIQVVSLDWKWLFIYPDENVAAVNELVVPADASLEFVLTSATVMNAFFVPQLGSQIYTMPGMTTHLNLRADEPGDYAGISSHYSGDGFSDMRFVVHAVSPTDYQQWLEHTRSEPAALDTASYADLARASSNVTPQLYGKVDPMMLDHILQTATHVPATGQLQPAAP
jgi:cytochrome o ubiquinol oxidase subunit II